MNASYLQPETGGIMSVKSSFGVCLSDYDIVNMYKFGGDRI